VDEVLAVGDAEFQKKCILRMENMAKTENRTILFVSHDLKAISTLCPNCLILKEGNVDFIGETKEAISNYLKQKGSNEKGIINYDKKILEFQGIKNAKELQGIIVNKNIECKIELDVLVDQKVNDVFIDAAIYNEKREMVIHSKTKYVGSSFSFDSRKKYTINYFIEKPNLSPGVYNLSIYIYQEGIDKEPLLWIDEIPFCNVLSANPYGVTNNDFLDEVKSIIFPFAHFTIND
jgi:lipopolysaccharide transport system ATP-binding protein